MWQGFFEDTTHRVNLLNSDKSFKAGIQRKQTEQDEVKAAWNKSLQDRMFRNLSLGSIHMISAFYLANDVVIGRVKIAEKSNKITAIPELLKLLNISGYFITIDAMG
jgi:hypothetical protein